MRTFHLWETGHKRKNNEDSYLLMPETGLWAVADGMGGHQAGEVASALAVDTLRQRAPQLGSLKPEQALTWLDDVFHAANQSILEAARQQGQEGMGTTMTVLALLEKNALFGHLGDSRAYLWRRHELTLLTRDHTVVYQMMLDGVLTEEQISSHPRRNELTQALGGDLAVEADCWQIAREPGDLFLLCTDGFSNSLTAEEMRIGLDANQDRAALLSVWRDMVLERGAPDNFTLVCVET